MAVTPVSGPSQNHVYAAPKLHSTVPSGSDFGPNKPVTAGPEASPNRNIQRLQKNQVQKSQQREEESQLGNSALPQQGPSSASALQQTINQNVNSHQLSQRLAAASVRS
ncbi:MAG: hypothetical protein K2W99_04515 [Chthoniobacterales bacterium]|nr:hypothetical protein [Chthoniobacterales bacterium]